MKYLNNCATYFLYLTWGNMFFSRECSSSFSPSSPNSSGGDSRQIQGGQLEAKRQRRRSKQTTGIIKRQANIKLQFYHRPAVFCVGLEIKLDLRFYWPLSLQRRQRPWWRWGESRRGFEKDVSKRNMRFAN